MSKILNYATAEGALPDGYTLDELLDLLDLLWMAFGCPVAPPS